MYSPISLSISSSTFFITSSRALSFEKPDIFSNKSSCCFFVSSISLSVFWISFCFKTKLLSLWSNIFSRFWSISSRLSMLFSLCSCLSSSSLISFFFSFTSFSTSNFNLWASSLASNKYSRFIFSASLWAFSTMFSALSLVCLFLMRLTIITEPAPKESPSTEVKMDSVNVSICSLTFYLYS